jgi:hypothetical protein
MIVPGRDDRRDRFADVAKITGYVWGHCEKCKRKLLIITQLTFPSGKQVSVQAEKALVFCIVCNLMKELFGARLEKRAQDKFRNN